MGENPEEIMNMTNVIQDLLIMGENTEKMTSMTDIIRDLLMRKNLEKRTSADLTHLHRGKVIIEILKNETVVEKKM